VSNWAAWQIVKRSHLGAPGPHRIDSLQAYYSVAGRDLERELVPMMRSEGIGLLVWSRWQEGCSVENTAPGKHPKKAVAARRSTFLPST